MFKTVFLMAYTK